jgi:hypothetical protein
LKCQKLLMSSISTSSIGSMRLWVVFESMPTIRIAVLCLLSLGVHSVECTSISISLLGIYCLELHRIESTLNGSDVMVGKHLLPSKSLNIVHQHWVDCMSPSQRVDSISPTFLHIRKLYCRLWTTPGVSERMWSETFEAWITGDNRTLGGYSGWRSE